PIRGKTRAFLDEAREAALQHFAHHPEIVAGRDLLGADVELAIAVLLEAVRPGNDHRTDRACALYVRIVVDLDARRCVFEAHYSGKAFEQARLARAFGKLAAESVLGVLQGVAHEIELVAAPRHRNLDAASGPYAQRFLEKRPVLETVGEQNELRRRLVFVELRDERAEHILRRQRFVGTREIGAVAPVLKGAEEEHLHAGLARFLMQSEDIRFLDRARIDALVRLYGRERGEAVAIARGGFEIHALGGVRHARRKLALYGLALAGQEIVRLADKRVVIVER